MPNEEEMDKAIERYNQAKADGTLDEKFPVIGNIKSVHNPCPYGNDECPICVPKQQSMSTPETENNWEKVKKEFIDWFMSKGKKPMVEECADWWINKISSSRKELIEEISGKIAVIYIGWQGRTENRDDSQDDSFLDGTEVMQEKILTLLSSYKDHE